MCILLLYPSRSAGVHNCGAGPKNQKQESFPLSFPSLSFGRQYYLSHSLDNTLSFFLHGVSVFLSLSLSGKIVTITSPLALSLSLSIGEVERGETQQ